MSPTLRHAIRSAARCGAACLLLLLACAPALADRLHMTDGTIIEVEEAWEDAQGVWYRRAGITHLLERARVRRVEKARRGEVARPGEGVSAPTATTEKAAAPEARGVWIHLVGGARMEVDEVNETAEGVWFRRGNVTLMLDRSRVASVERGGPAAFKEARATRPRAWSTGRAQLDELIRRSGARHGVDPYLIFCVMEQESHFNPRAVSRAGARGLMQLMPGTARRFGVRDVHDPAQNIDGGTRYLKELMGMFDGRVDLVLAGYNAGEGAVMRYGRRVPPYAETRNYVKRIGARYGGQAPAAKAKPAAGGED